MTISALPTPPTRSDPVNFASRADAFLAALPTFQTEANATAAAMNLNSTTDTSASSVAVGLGAKTFAVTAGKSFQLGMFLVVADTAAPSTNFMIGQVTSYSTTTLIVDVGYAIGSGTKTAWTISQSVPAMSLNSTSVDINGGTIDGTVIGSAAPAAGSFTTVSATGGINTAVGSAIIAGSAAVAPSIPSATRGVIHAAGSSDTIISWGTAATHNGYIYGSSGLTQFLSLPPIEIVVAGTTRAALSSSGLAVTGALSASGDLTLNGYLIVGPATTPYHNSNSVFVRAPVGDTYLNHITGTGSGVPYLGFGYAGGAIGSITQSGTTAVAYNTTSDHRLKTNVRDANAAWFMDIQFRDFEWVDGRHDCGVIAHELQAVYPDLVMGDKDATEQRTIEITPAVAAVLDEEGVEITPAIPAVTEEQTFPVYQQVNYMGLIGRMGTVIQQQQRAIEALTARITTLEANHA